MNMSAAEILDREFLEIRAKILEIAASFDRIDRADGDMSADDRYGKLRMGIEILTSSEKNRAERVQLLFSREYDEDWREKLQITGPSSQ